MFLQNFRGRGLVLNLFLDYFQAREIIPSIEANQIYFDEWSKEEINEDTSSNLTLSDSESAILEEKPQIKSDNVEEKPDQMNLKKKAMKMRKNAKNFLKCPDCDREFDRNSALQNHQVTAHSEERNFACDHCDFKAKINLVLMRHIRRKHHKELNFVCKICGKKFFESYRLKCHEETHIKVRLSLIEPKLGQIFDQNETIIGP